MACPTSPGAATPANARRWKQRPEGANRGDFGAGDPIGRLDLPTPERVKRAVAEGREGRPCCPSLPPLARPPPRTPPRPPPPRRRRPAPAPPGGGWPPPPGAPALTPGGQRNFFP